MYGNSCIHVWWPLLALVAVLMLPESIADACKQLPSAHKLPCKFLLHFEVHELWHSRLHARRSFLQGTLECAATHPGTSGRLDAADTNTDKTTAEPGRAAGALALLRELLPPASMAPDAMKAGIALP